MNFDEKVVDRIKRLEREVERLRVKESPGAWLNWTPTITWAGGTTDPTSETISYSRYAKIGKVVFFTFRVTIVVGAGDRTMLTFSPPTACPPASSSVLPSGVTGWERVSTGDQTVCPAWVSSATQISIQFGGMTADQHITASGFYEAA